MGKDIVKKARMEKVNDRIVTKWTDDDVTNLLAWLDFSLRYGIKQADFDVSIEKRMKELCGKPFKKLQVRNKLAGLWQRHSSNNSKTRRDIFRYGSRCFVHLPDALKQAVAHEVDWLDGLLQNQQPGLLDDLKCVCRIPENYVESQI